MANDLHFVTVLCVAVGMGMHDMYDPMKAGYGHLDSSGRYADMYRAADMYGTPPSSYPQMSQFSPPVHSQVCTSNILDL